jgi:hypothetical protein
MAANHTLSLVLWGIIAIPAFTALPTYASDGGQITALALDPLTPTTIYAGTAVSGVFKTTDAGATWNATGLTGGAVHALVIDPQNPTNVYAAFSNAGIVKSADGGTNWSATGLTSGFVRRLAIDPLTPTTLYAVIPDAGVFKSTDAGATWNASLRVEWLFGQNPTLQALAIDPHQPTSLYVSAVFITSEMVWVEALKSWDAGLSWCTTGYVNFYSEALNAFAIEPRSDPLMPAPVYAGFDAGLFRSTDEGANWNATGLNDARGGPTIGTLAIDPNQPATVYAGLISGWVAATIMKSVDGGVSWNSADKGLFDALIAYGLGTAITAVVIDPSSPTTLYAGTAVGVFKSVDEGDNWSATGLIQRSPLGSVTLGPRSVAGGDPSTGMVTLATGTLGSDVTVTLSSTNPAVVTVPDTVTVPAGSTSATFTASTSVVSATTVATISASFDGAIRSADIGVHAPTSISAIWWLDFSVAGGTATRGRVVMGRAPGSAGDLVVMLTSSDPAAASVPASVTVLAGETYADFIISSHPVAGPTPVTISGTYGNTESVVITVSAAPATLSSVSLNSPSITGGFPTYGTVTLNGTAILGGPVIRFSSSDGAANVPVSVQVGAGESRVNFTIGTRAVPVATPVTISASLDGITRSAILVVDPVPVVIPPAVVSSVGVAPSNVSGGTPATGTVTLSGAAPTEGAAVVLWSSNAAIATLPSSVTIAPGATSVDFSVSTGACSSGSVTISGSYGGVLKSAILTVTSATDNVAIQRAHYVASKRELRVEATSTNSTATLEAFVTSSGAPIGQLTNVGGGNHTGRFTWPVTPQNITVRATSCGSATKPVTLK